MLFFLFAIVQIVSCSKLNMTPEQSKEVGKLILSNPKALVPLMKNAKKSDIGAVIKMLSSRIHTLDDEKAKIKAKIVANDKKQEEIKEEIAESADAGQEVSTPVVAEPKLMATPAKVSADKATNLLASLKKVASSKKHGGKKKGSASAILAILPLLLKGLGGH